MIKQCIICGKSRLAGKVLTRKGLAKKKGGTGSKIARATKKFFLANLQRVTILQGNRKRTVYACAKCIKAGKVKKV